MFLGLASGSLSAASAAQLFCIDLSRAAMRGSVGVVVCASCLSLEGDT